MENTPILLVPGFFLFVLVRIKNKKLTNSDGIRFIVSIFLVSFILLGISHFLTAISTPLLFEIPSDLQKALEKIVKDVEVPVYINSFAVAFCWYALTRLNFLVLLNYFYPPDFFRELLDKLEAVKKDKDQFSQFFKLPWRKILIIILLGSVDRFFLQYLRMFLNPITDKLFLGEDSIHCNELEKRIKSLVLISLKNEKVYIGRIESADINIIANTDDIIKIVPIFSGYRDHLKKVHLTTEYTGESKNSKVEASILIFKREVASISNFDLEIAKEFVAKSMLQLDADFNSIPSSNAP